MHRSEKEDGESEGCMRETQECQNYVSMNFTVRRAENKLTILTSFE